MQLTRKRLHAPSLNILTIPLFMLLLALSCSKSTDPDSNKPPDDGPIGILLSGLDTDPALSGTSNHGPYAVPGDEWNGDFVTTRLEAVINPNAAVGGVNTALNAVSAKISCMRAGLVFTELVVPAQASEDQAKVTCSTLVASGAFLSAYPCFDPTDGNEATMFPGFPANSRLTYLEQAKFPAAWNLRERVAALHSPVTVMVADKFARLTPHVEIPSQTFVAGAGTVDTLLDDRGLINGNHGFAVAGIIGARFDDIGSTGAFADTSDLLRLPCASTVGLGSWAAVITEVFMRLPSSGRFILNTSWGYSFDFSVISKRQRIEHALYWRALVAGRQNDFLHTQSSGNNGFFSSVQTNADYNSPFTLTARFDTPLQMLQGTAIPPADSTALTTLFAQLVAHDATNGTRLRNVITVGSSDWNGGLSTFSNGPTDVRMIGETITLPCIMGDAICNPGTDVAWQGRWNGTSFATPQVAALAGWLWSLSPALTVDETKTILMNCYNNKWVDAYKAVLSLDHSISNAGIRLSLLDVSDATGQKGSDMKFDEKDLQMFLDSIMYYEADRGSKTPPWPRDHSPFDLNGDGYTGDTMLTPSTAPFDLDINTPPAYSQLRFKTCIDTSLNESSVTDRDILYYYAFTTLYTGDKVTRDEIFGCPDTTITGYHLSIGASGGYPIQYASTRDLQVIVEANTGQGDIPIEGASIQISVTGAKLSANSGSTDAQGEFRVNFDADYTFDTVLFAVTASKGGAFLLTDTAKIPITIYAGWVGQWDEVGDPTPSECNGNPNYPTSSLLQLGWAINHLEGTITGFATGDYLIMKSVTRTEIVAETSGSGITGEIIITRVPGGEPCEISAVWTRYGGCTVSYNYPTFVKRLCTSLP